MTVVVGQRRWGNKIHEVRDPSRVQPHAYLHPDRDHEGHAEYRFSPTLEMDMEARGMLEFSSLAARNLHRQLSYPSLSSQTTNSWTPNIEIPKISDLHWGVGYEITISEIVTRIVPLVSPFHLSFCDCKMILWYSKYWNSRLSLKSQRSQIHVEPWHLKLPFLHLWFVSNDIISLVSIFPVFLRLQAKIVIFQVEFASFVWNSKD